MQDVHGKVAVITGGASGMGRAFADRFAAEGMKLVLADIEEPELARAVDELKASGAEAIGVRTDVARIEDVQALRERARERVRRGARRLQQRGRRRRVGDRFADRDVAVGARREPVGRHPRLQRRSSRICWSRTTGTS